MIRNPSPLRYPGGKYKISQLVEILIRKLPNPCTTYVEPFAGGAGVALDLLFRGVVENVIINDSDRAIYSFWRAVLTETDAFIDRLFKTKVNLEEWQRQRSVYLTSKGYSLELGFATFFLNRTNRSGILSAGPIGGQAQDGWTLDVRYNTEELATRIKKIGDHRKRIKVYNRDVFSLLKRQLPPVSDDAFVYLDPPYYKRGKKLYKNYFDNRLHRMLCETIRSTITCPWIVTYDDTPEIREIYRGVVAMPFRLNYSLANHVSGREIMFFYDAGLVPHREELVGTRFADTFSFQEVVAND